MPHKYFNKGVFAGVEAGPLAPSRSMRAKLYFKLN